MFIEPPLCPRHTVVGTWDITVKKRKQNIGPLPLESIDSSNEISH